MKKKFLFLLAMSFILWETNILKKKEKKLKWGETK